MKFISKNIKKIIISIVILIILIIGGIYLFLFLNDENALTVEERNWIDENINSTLNINVVNNSNIFGQNGEGVYYDFINDFALNYGLTINPITFEYGTEKEGLSLNVAHTIDENDLIIYEDHYVLISKNDVTINSYEEIDNKTIGVIKNDLSYLSTKKDLENTTLNSYESETDLITALGTEINYAVVPLNLYMDLLLNNSYYVNFHMSNINYYYVLNSDDSYFSSVLEKYYNSVWIDKFNDSYNTNQFNLFTDNLNITQTDIATLTGNIYKYGFLENGPYEIIQSGEFGGISAVTLSYFSNFANVEFEFEKYDSHKDFINSIEDNNVDIYLDKYIYNNNLNAIEFGSLIEYSVIANIDNDVVINSLNSLVGKTVYVENNSKLHDYINKIGSINIKTYESEKELFKLNREDVIIIVDKFTYATYNKLELDNYTERYTDFTNIEMTYKINNNETLYMLLNYFIKVTDLDRISNVGLNNFYETYYAGQLWSIITRYIIVLAIVITVILYIIVRKTKKIQIAKKIKRDDKLKFIDQLTSLKNRNYLNECIEKWDNNTIYPQTTILVNLNKVQEINDHHGYNEGDRQIKSFANALIKTQLDNSEIMRTDGNEFVIY